MIDTLNFNRPRVVMIVAFFLGTLWLYSFFFGGTDDHIRAHLSLTRAIANGTVVVDRYTTETHDLAFHDGHFYVAKPPGFAMTVAPLWSLLDETLSLDSLWRLSTWLFSSIPGAFAMVVFLLIVLRLGTSPQLALLFAIAVALGTGTFAYSTMFLELPLVTLCLLLACLLLIEPEPSSRRSLVIGLLCGYACLLQYLVVFCALPAAFLVIRRKKPILPAIAFGYGMAMPLTGVLGYNYVCFSNPLLFGHFTSAVPTFQKQHEEIFRGLFIPHPEALFGLSFSPSKGVLFFSPFLLLAAIGMGIIIADKSQGRVAVAFGAMFVITFLFVSSLPNWPGGILSGPRYLLPVVPVLAIGLAGLERINSKRAIEAIQPLAALLATWSILIWSMLSVLAPFSKEWLPNPLFQQHIPDLVHGRIRPNVASAYLGIDGSSGVVFGFAIAFVVFGISFVAANQCGHEPEEGQPSGA